MSRRFFFGLLAGAAAAPVVQSKAAGYFIGADPASAPSYTIVSIAYHPVLVPPSLAFYKAVMWEALRAESIVIRPNDKLKVSFSGTAGLPLERIAADITVVDRLGNERVITKEFNIEHN